MCSIRLDEGICRDVLHPNTGHDCSPRSRGNSEEQLPVNRRPGLRASLLAGGSKGHVALPEADGSTKAIYGVPSSCGFALSMIKTDLLQALESPQRASAAVYDFLYCS